MANQRKRGSKTHGDITGRKAAKLTAELEEEKKREAQRVAQATKVREDGKEEVVNLVRQQPKRKGPEPEVIEVQDGSPREEEEPDATVEALVADADQPAPREVGGIVREQRGGPTIVEPETAIIRANYDLEQVTVGAGNHYDFEEGRKYEVPLNVAKHLAQKEIVDILS